MTKDKEEFSDTYKEFVDQKNTPGATEKKRQRKTPASGKKDANKKPTPKSKQKKEPEKKEDPPVDPPSSSGRPSRRASIMAAKHLKDSEETEGVSDDESEEEMEDLEKSEDESDWDAPNSEEEKPKRGTKRKAPSTPAPKKTAAVATKGKGSTGRTRKSAPSPSERESEESEGGSSEGESGGNKENGNGNRRRGNTAEGPVTETPFEKDLVMKDSYFECGKFLVNRADFKLTEYPAVWRMDGKSLIQKYEFMKVEKGKPKYRSISTYAGYNFAQRRLYYPVTTKHISQEKNEHIVNFAKPGVDFSFSEGMQASIQATENMKEAFEVYLQALVTYALEPSFFEEVVKDNDRFFLDPLDQIEEENNKRAEKLRPGLVWAEKLTKNLERYPLLHTQIVPMIPSEKCQACRERAMTRKVEFRGGNYEPLVLRVEETPSSETPVGICYQCIDVFLVYHRLKHLRLLLFRTCDTAVQRLKDEEKANSEILESLLNDVDWVQKLFRDMQVYWAESDVLIASSEKYNQEKEKKDDTNETANAPSDSIETLASAGEA